MPSDHLILCHPFSSCLQSFPASASFLMSLCGQSFGASAAASVPPMNTQDWSPLGWPSWISLQSKGLSRVFSNTSVQKHQFFSARPSYGLTLTPIHDYRKNHSTTFLSLIDVQLIYIVVLISAVQQSDSVIYICIYLCVYIYTYIYIYTFFFIFFSIVVYHSILNIIPCAPQ